MNKKLPEKIYLSSIFNNDGLCILCGCNASCHPPLNKELHLHSNDITEYCRNDAKYTVDEVIDKFSNIISNPKVDNFQKAYYEALIAGLKWESKYPLEVAKAGKHLYHYFKQELPILSYPYFEMLYNVWHPVRNNIETLDSVEVDGKRFTI